MKITDLIPFLSLIFSLLAVFGGGVAYFRRGYSRSADEIQQRVINALQTENKTLTARVERCEQETTLLRQVIETVQALLKSRGIIVNVENDIVTVVDAQGAHSTLARAKKPRNGGVTP